MVLSGKKKITYGGILLLQLIEDVIIYLLVMWDYPEQKKQYNNSGWHVSCYFKTNDIIRKFESFAHTECNIDEYKNKEYLSKCIKDGKNILNDEQYILTDENKLPDY